ncbi:hypothetical protein SUBVAR_07175 [Subdoligranulum variabile DSM 15176]|uniref:Uncharacterized protein n=1 Tax=Subdoligranulum variabile DSM 15176 TaxID=411471 RepID=D1PRZ2_9FIRM|nr:hypothetical protein SUBVAR_07175 [Subdoligranulum variabile DSM 15176]
MCTTSGAVCGGYKRMLGRTNGTRDRLGRRSGQMVVRASIKRSKRKGTAWRWRAAS